VGKDERAVGSYDCSAKKIKKKKRERGKIREKKISSKGTKRSGGPGRGERGNPKRQMGTKPKEAS